MNGITQIVDSIYDITGTSKPLSTDNADLITLVSGNLAASPALPPSVLIDIMGFCVNLLNAESLKGLLIAQTVVYRLLKGLLDRAPSGHNRQILDAVNMFRQTLATSYAYSDPIYAKMHDKDYPLHKSDNPILYVHLVSMQYPSYDILVLSVHRALLHIKEALDNDKNLTPEKRVARFEGDVTPFQHLFHLYESNLSEVPFSTNIPPKAKIEETLSKGSSEQKVKYTNPKVIDRYTEIVDTGLNKKYASRQTKAFSKRTRDFLRTSWGIQIFYGKDRLVETYLDELLQCVSTDVVTFNDGTKAEADDGGHPFDTCTVINDAANKTRKLQMFQDQIRPLLYPSLWSKTILDLNTYSLLLCRVLKTSPDDLGMKDLAETVALLTVIMFGFNLKAALNSEIRTIPKEGDKLPRETIFCSPDGRYFFYQVEQDRVATKFLPTKERVSKKYMKVGTTVFLPTGRLEGLIATLVQKSKQNTNSVKHLFAYDDGAAYKRVTANSVNERLKFLSEGLPFKLSTFALSRSAVYYATESYSIDPTIVDYMFNRSSRELRSQVFYTHVTCARIHRDVLSFQDHFLKDIRENTHAMGIQSKGFNALDTQSTCVSSDFSHIAVGSRYTPETGTLKEDLKRMRVLIDQSDDHVLRYNLFTVYTTIIWMITCALRPVEISDIIPDAIGTDSQFLLVKAKGNKQYDEQRLILLSDLAIASLPGIQKAKEEYTLDLHVKSNLSLNQIHSEGAFHRTFSLAGKNGIPRPITSSAMKHFLVKSPVNFDYKLNSPRHLVRTHLFNSRVPIKAINEFMGHQTKGKESAFYYSLDELEESRRTVSVHIANLVDQLQLDLVSY